MSLFGAYAFSEVSFSSSIVNVVVEVTGVEATFSPLANTVITTGSTFVVNGISEAVTSFNNDGLNAIGGALFTIEVINAAQSIFSGDTRIFNNVFGMTPERYLAYPKTITRDESILGASNQSQVFNVVQNHMLYVIENQPGVYDDRLVSKTYNNNPIDPSFINWIARADIRSPYRVAIGNLTQTNRIPVGIIPSGAPAQSDIDIMQDYFNGVGLSDDVYARVQQLIWGVPNDLIVNARTYSTVTNADSQSYSEEQPAASNAWNDLVI